MIAMKNSGIEWIDQIPNNWTVNRIKNMFNAGKGLSITKADLIDQGLPVISYGQIHSKLNNGTDIKASLLRFVDYSYKKYYPQCKVNNSDFVFADTSEDYDGIGNCVYKRDDSLLYAGYHAIVLKSKVPTDNRYLAYLFQTDAWRKQLRESASGVKVFSVSQRALLNASIILPTNDEMISIANYLDEKCAEIDALSADVQAEIETLEAYKKSKIFEIVEHGIGHTDFVKTESEIWKKIPVGWQLVDIKYIFEIVKRIAGREGYEVIAITQKGLKYKDLSANEGQIASDYSGYQFVYPGDYAMNHMDLLTGWVDLSDKFGVTSPDYRVFRLRDKDNYDSEYYKYVMQCCYMCQIFYSLGQGVSNLGRWRLQTSVFNNFKIPVPHYEEQVEIGKYLSKEISQIDDIIEQKQEQLTVLADYKKSLIYEYVTGKKDVPEI